MADPETPESRRNFGSYLRVVGAFAFLVTIFMAGFGISSSNWSSSNATLQNDLRHSQEELSKARQELAQVKSEYAVFRQKSITGESSAQIKEVGNQKTSGQTESGPLAKGQASETVSVGTGKTGYAFNGEVSISVAATPFEGNPLRHMVIATVGSSGFPSLTIDRKDIGFTATYKTKDTFEILVTAANTFSAEFRVTRIPK